MVNPHEIIRKAKVFWEDKPEISNIHLQDSDPVLFLNVSKKNLHRALCFIDALVKLLEYRGYQLKLTINGQATLYLNHKKMVEIRLREALKRITPKAGEDKAFYVSTDQFILRLSNSLMQKEWRDKNVLLEEILSLIVAKIEMITNEV